MPLLQPWEEAVPFPVLSDATIAAVFHAVPSVQTLVVGLVSAPQLQFAKSAP